MSDKIKEIDIQIDIYNRAKQRVDALRQDIAIANCPIQVGEEIQYTKNGKVYKGLIQKICYVVKHMEVLGLNKENEVGWNVCGVRVLKSTNQPGDIAFGVNSFEHTLVDGVWVEEVLTQQERLNRIFNR